MKNFKIYLLLLAVMPVMMSCSNSVEPISASAHIKQHTNLLPSLEYECDLLNAPVRYPGVFGAWEVHLNADTLDAEIIPARNAHAIGDIYDVDLSQFLTVSPCANCLRIVSVSHYLFDFTYLVTPFSWQWNIEFGLKHPFSNINTRPDLHGFDVRAIFIFKDSNLVRFDDISIMRPDGTEEPAELSLMLLNRDGFTSHFDELVNDERYFVGGVDCPGNLNPYLRFFDDFSDAPFDPHSPSGHNVLPVGSEFRTRNAIVSGTSVSFYIIADVSYGQSAILANRTNPQYYLPSFHRTEPWRVEYWLENNNLGGSGVTATADLVVQVFDWQHNAAVDPDYPDPENLGGIRESSKVANLEFSIPALNDNLYTTDTPEAGTGTLSDPLRYRITFRNQFARSGIEYGLLAIRDELHGQAAPHGRIPVPESPAGFPYETLDICDYTMYELIYVNIPPDIPYLDPIYNNEIQYFEYTAYSPSISASLGASFFMDPTGTKFRYVWDKDYDGVTFDVDAEGMPGILSGLRNGRNNVGLGVITNSVPPRQYSYTLPVYVKGTLISELYDTGDLHEKVSNTRGHSLAMTSDHYYMVYMSNTLGIWDIFLGVYDHRGESNHYLITDISTLDCGNPSIVVVEDGPDQGVYIAFTVYEAGRSHLWSVRRNLDGSGSSHETLEIISDAPGHAEDNAVLVYSGDGRLFAYFNSINTSTMALNVMCTSSDMGETWTVHGAIDTSTSTNRNNVTAVYSSATDEVICIWEDYRNYGSRMIDLYMARSDDGINFGAPINISSSNSYQIEVSASASIHDNQLAIAYLFGYLGMPLKTHLKIINIDTMSFTDYAIKLYNETRMTYPTVATSTEGKFTVAYAAWNSFTNNLRPCLVEVDFTESLINPIETDLLFGCYYDVTLTDITDMHMGVVNRPVAYGQAVDNFVVWTSFENGMETSSSPYEFHYGNMRIVSIVTDGKPYSWF